MPRAVITGTGMYAPDRVVPNTFFDQLYGRDLSSFLVEKRNIRERRWMAPEQCTSDLALPAARDALAAAGVAPGELDLLIVATDTPDQPSPSTAAVLAHKLGVLGAGTFDLNSACAGFVTAVDVASKFITTDARYQRVLVVGAYAMSKWLDLEDYKIASLFADGAGAVVLRPGQVGGVLGSQLWTDPQYHDHMGIYAGGSRKPIDHGVLGRREHLLAFPKRIPPETNGLHWPRLARELLGRVGRRPDEVRHWFLTQFNLGSIHETMDSLGLPRERAHLVMDRYGYTGSASIGMCIADAVAAGKVAPGDLCVLIGSGGGMSMAALALEWG